jgi:allophanate hydrolase/aspartyl-tRNA(Asn)/glutamyl-tRNA(Gln) amidotransferase subunit A
MQASVLHDAYLTGALDVADVVDAVYARIAARGEDGVWITLVPRDVALARARELDSELTAARAAARHGPAGGEFGGLDPLFGLPFAVKDNIDIVGLPTTAACPAFAYSPQASAPLVERMLAAGAVCIGKTNLDQFATGLSGTRSPYGTPASPFDPQMIAGGSSSGSAIAVSAGLVTFAIGTDTAGSGRVPAALTNTVGFKPSRGLVSTRGIVPACRSLDCPSVFALSVPDARLVLSVIAGYDDADPFSRRLPKVSARDTRDPATVPGQGDPDRPGRARVGAPNPGALEFFGDPGAAAVYRIGLELIAETGAEVVEIDVAPFLDTGPLLYEGPWLAERYAAFGEFVAAHPDTAYPGAIHPVTRTVVTPGAKVTGVDVFRGIERLAALRREVEKIFSAVDAIVLPTVPTTYRIESVLADPVRLNSRLGIYTTAANLLDLAAVAVPAGFAAGLPFGVSLAAPAGTDGMLASIASHLHARTDLDVGATVHPLATWAAARPRGRRPESITR